MLAMLPAWRTLTPKASPFTDILPGTHGRIYAWAPPPGIPRGVLEELRDELHEKLLVGLKQVVTSSSYNVEPRYSFPVNSNSNELDPDPTDALDMLYSERDQEPTKE
jgi:hypothetical protein